MNFLWDLEWVLDMNIFQDIVCRFGKPDIDLFTSRLNHKLKKYISFRSDPNAMAVNAFSISWTKHYVYIFCTFQHPQYMIVEDKAEALVVAPFWTTRSWLPQLAHLIVDFPIKLPPTCKILYQPRNPRKNSATTETETRDNSRN